MRLRVNVGQCVMMDESKKGRKKHTSVQREKEREDDGGLGRMVWRGKRGKETRKRWIERVCWCRTKKRKEIGLGKEWIGRDGWRYDEDNTPHAYNFCPCQNGEEKKGG